MSFTDSLVYFKPIYSSSSKQDISSYELVVVRLSSDDSGNWPYGTSIVNKLGL